MKKFYLSVLFFAVLLLSVYAASAAVQIESITSTPGNPGSSASVQAVVRNTNPTSSVTVIFTSSALTGPGGSISAPTAISNLVVPANGTATRTFAVALPYIQSGGYTGTLQAKDFSDASNVDEKPYSVTINSVYSLDVTDRDTSANKLIVTGDQGDRLTGTFKVKNVGSEPVVDLALSFNQADFQDGDDDRITISHNMPTTLEPNVEVTVTLNINLDDAIDMDTYSGTITVSGGGKSDTFTLEVRVQPEVCSDGRVGRLRLTIREPDSGDDFKPGDKISIEVKVENDADEDLDVTVTAFLFDVDDSDNVEEIDSDEINIDEDDTETFEFDLIIPEDVDDGHEFRLYIKAYEDGNEDEQCDENFVKIDIKREKNDVVVRSIRIEPATAKIGDTVAVTVTARNIGSRDQDDVIIRILNSELGVDLESRPFELERFDKDDTKIERFTFKIPADAGSGVYDLEAIVTFGSRTSSTFAPLRVEAPPLPPEAFAELDISDVPSSVEIGKSFDMAVRVSNTGDIAGTFRVEMTLGAWAKSVQPQTITLSPGRTGTLFFTVQTEPTATGSQSATVRVLSGTEVLDEQSFSVNLKQPEAPPVTGFGAALAGVFSGTTLWIIADILLIIIAIVFIRMLFKSRKRE